MVAPVRVRVASQDKLLLPTPLYPIPLYPTLVPVARYDYEALWKVAGGSKRMSECRGKLLMEVELGNFGIWYGRRPMQTSRKGMNWGLEKVKIVCYENPSFVL